MDVFAAIMISVALVLLSNPSVSPLSLMTAGAETLMNLTGGITGLSLTRENVSEIGPPQAQIREGNSSDISSYEATNISKSGSKDLSKFKSDGGQGDDNNDTVPLFVESAVSLNNTVVTINNGPTTDTVYTSQNSSNWIDVSDQGTEKYVNETEESGVQKTNATNVENNGNQNDGNNKDGRSTAKNSHVQKREAIMKRVSKFVYLTEEEERVDRLEGAEE